MVYRIEIIHSARKQVLSLPRQTQVEIARGDPANPLAHETSTGPEIWAQMNHEVDAIVVGVGSSGTLTGLSRFFAKVQPDCEIILADPHFPEDQCGYVALAINYRKMPRYPYPVLPYLRIPRPSREMGCHISTTRPLASLRD